MGRSTTQVSRRGTTVNTHTGSRFLPKYKLKLAHYRLYFKTSPDMDVLMGDVQSDSLGKLMSMDLDDDDLAVLTN